MRDQKEKKKDKTRWKNTGPISNPVLSNRNITEASNVNKIFPEIQNLKDFLTRIPALLEMLKDILHAEGENMREISVYKNKENQKCCLNDTNWMCPS